MKKFFSILVLLSIPFACFAQLKSKVCVVREVFYEKTVEDLQDFSNDFAKHGEKDLANAIEKYLNGGSFGTGFVYVAPDGKNYIITNRHVVEQAKACNIEFTNPDSSVSKYEGLTIFAVSQDIDLAILAFPPDVQPFKEGLPFYAGPISDGDLVFTAGFPAFDGEPSWQLGTGNVTNANAKITKLINPEITTLIQHSAQVDPGNSGGPLLRRTKTGEYVVVGVNTWKAMNRQAANFSLPSLVVQDFIRTSLTKSNVTNPEEEVLKRAQDFEKVIADWNAEYDQIVPYISMDFVADYGKQIFNEVLNKASANTKKTILNEFFYESPIAGFRYAIAWHIFYEYHKNDKSKTKGEEIDLPGFELLGEQEDSGNWNVLYYLPGTKKVVTSEWLNENGIWQLYSFQYGKNTKPKARNSKKKKAAASEETENPTEESLESEESRSGKGFDSSRLFTVPGKFTVIAGINGNVSFFNKSNLLEYFNEDFIEYIKGEWNITNFFALNLQLKVKNKFITIDDEDPLKGYYALVGPQLQLPLNFGVFEIMPFANLNAGCQLNNPEAIRLFVTATSEVGLRLMINQEGKSSLFMDLGGLYEVNMDFTKEGQYIFHDMGYKILIDFGVTF